MLEMTTTRHNPLIDPQLAVWSWEIPVYLFFGGIVAGMMVLAGVAMLRIARGDDSRSFFSAQTPLLGFILMNVGMLALLLDLTHRLYVWRIYTTFQWTSPMSWGSWVLIVVYGVLLVSALIRLPDAWPWLGRTVPLLKTLSDTIVAKPPWIAVLGWTNSCSASAWASTPASCSTRWWPAPCGTAPSSAPLFLFSGLSAGAAVMHLASAALHGRPAPQGMVGGAFSAMLQPMGAQPPDRKTVDSLIRFDQLFLVIELVLIALLILNLQTSSASHAAAAALIMTGPYALPFWAGVVGVGVLLPLAWQALELTHRVAHTVAPALLVLAGGFTLRWVMVNAGQLSQIVPVASLGQ